MPAGNAQQTAIENEALISKFFTAEAQRMSSASEQWEAILLGETKKGYGWGLRGPGKAHVDFVFDGNILAVEGVGPKGKKVPGFKMELEEGTLEDIKGALSAVTRPS